MADENAGIVQDTARERLLEAGLYLFANYGIEGVRTRALAEKAGVNQSAIPYYFGGKEGVYAAVIARITDELEAGLTPSGPYETLVTQFSIQDRHKDLEQLRNLIKKFTQSLLSPGRSVERIMLIVREQLQPTKNFEVIFSRFIEPLHKMICNLIAWLQSRQAEEIDVVIQAQALVGQALSFAVAQQAFLRRIGKEEIDKVQIEDISEIVAAMAIAAVSGAGR